MEAGMIFFPCLAHETCLVWSIFFPYQLPRKEDSQDVDEDGATGWKECGFSCCWLEDSQPGTPTLACAVSEKSTFIKLLEFWRFLKNNLMYTLIFFFGCAGSSLLPGLPSSCSEQGLLSSCGAPAYHCGSFSCWGAQALGCVGSVDVSRRLSSCGGWT